MTMPINTQAIDLFIETSNLRALCFSNMNANLSNWFKDNPDEFMSTFDANLDRVLNTYRFDFEGISFSRSFSYDPPLNYISVYIRLYDHEDSYYGEYTAFFDHEINCFDDKFTSGSSNHTRYDKDCCK